MPWTPIQRAHSGARDASLTPCDELGPPALLRYGPIDTVRREWRPGRPRPPPPPGGCEIVMIAQHPRPLPALPPRRLALILLLAWLPVLLYVDHWPAPTLLQPGSTLGLHRHAAPSDGAAGADTAAHVEHGHGGSAESVAGTVGPPPPATSLALTAPLQPQADAEQPLHALADDHPEAPPPR